MEDQARIRLLLVDDHPIVRFGLAALLEMQPDFLVVSAVGSGEDALAALKEHPIDVVLLDLRLPGIAGAGALQKIGEIAPETRTIILSSFQSDEEIHAAIKAGAQGYVHKEAPPEEIIKAIRTVFNGKQAFPKRIIEKLNQRKMTAGLSFREQQVLEFVATGLTNKEIASALAISQFTVRNHLRRIAEKLEVSDRTEAVFVAIQTGLIKIDL